VRNGTHAEVAAVDGLLDEAARRGLTLRLSSVTEVLGAAAWFLARPPRENLVHRIREALTPREGGYVLAVAPASALLPPSKVICFGGTAEVNGRSMRVATVVVAVPATWAELERRRAEA